ncbi:MAG: hemolysin III family protein [Dehalococcoidia bacterium]
MDAQPMARPLLRGWIHLGAAFVAPAALAVLLLLASTPREYVTVGVFGASLWLLYLASGLYHTVFWRTRLRSVAQRMDHAAIFVFIGGTYTAFCLLALPSAWGIPLLAIAWTLAAAGAATRLAWPTMPRGLVVSMYAGLGWLAVVAAVPMAALSPVVPGLAALGGIVYTAGGLSYATRWPDVAPRWFGHHEVFHLAVLAGSTIHLGTITALIGGAF